MSAWPPTLAETKRALNKTDVDDDLELQGAIDAATAFLEAHPAYRIADAVKSTTRTEWHDGGASVIVLNHYPVVTLTSLTEYRPTANPLAAEPLDTTTTFTPNGYELTNSSGIVIRTSSGHPAAFAGRVKVVYDSGVASAPADIREAALMLVDHLWETQRGGAGAGAAPGLDIEETRATFGSQFGPAYALPNRVRELLEPYRVGPLVK